MLFKKMTLHSSLRLALVALYAVTSNLTASPVQAQTPGLICAGGTSQVSNKVQLNVMVTNATPRPVGLYYVGNDSKPKLYAYIPKSDRLLLKDFVGRRWCIVDDVAKEVLMVFTLRLGLGQISVPESARPPSAM